MTGADLALVAAGLVALGVLSEIAARTWLRARGRYYVWPPLWRLEMRVDREQMPDLEPVVHVEINRDGERGPPPPEEGAKSFRVLVAGGSVAECWYLDQDSSWPGVLQRILSQQPNLERLRVERVHVGNVARSLVACRHIDLVLERVLPRYGKLDVVVLMVGASDLVHWLESGTPAEIRDDIPLDRLFGRHPEGPFGWSPRRLALRRVASAAWSRVHRPLEVRGGVGASLARARRMRANAKRIIETVPDPAPMLGRFEKHLRAIVRRCKATGARVVVARQPWLVKEFTPGEQSALWMFGLGRVHEEEVEAYYSHKIVWRLMEAVDERASRVAREEGVEQIDLRPLLPADFETWYDEMHHTPRGCAIIGDAVARAITRES